jgi:hypothetical protein
MSMLTFIASLLFIENSTVDLLINPSSECDLFHVHLYPHEHLLNDHDEALHGATKLFASLGEQRTLRDGIAAACNPEITPVNPFSPPSLSGLWGLVNVWTRTRPIRPGLVGMLVIFILTVLLSAI